MNYIELLKKYNFEKTDLLELSELDASFECYKAVYKKELKTGEQITLAIYDDDSKMDIGWCASDIDFEEDAWGGLVEDKIGLEFLQILQEACEIMQVYNKNLGEKT